MDIKEKKRNFCGKKKSVDFNDWRLLCGGSWISGKVECKS